MNSATYNALLKLDRLAKERPDCAEVLSVVRKAMCDQSEEIRRLKIAKTVKESGRVPPMRLPADRKPLYCVAGVMVAGTPEVQAEAVCSATGRVDVYRYPSGAITWRKHGAKSQGNMEFIGTYDEGSDYRRVCEDLRVAA